MGKGRVQERTIAEVAGLPAGNDKDKISEFYQKHGKIPLDYPGYKANMFSEVIEIDVES
jgi:hypothetical protein